MQISRDDLRILILESMERTILERLSSTDPGFCDAVSQSSGGTPEENEAARVARHLKSLASCEKKDPTGCAQQRDIVARDVKRAKREYWEDFGQDEVLNIIDWSLVGAGAVAEMFPVVGTAAARGIGAASVATALAQKNYLGAALSVAMLIAPIVGTGLKAVGKTAKTGVKLPYFVLEKLLKGLKSIGSDKIEDWATQNLQDASVSTAKSLHSGELGVKMQDALDGFTKSIESLIGGAEKEEPSDEDIMGWMWCTTGSEGGGKKSGVSFSEFSNKMKERDKQQKDSQKSKNQQVALPGPGAAPIGMMEGRRILRRIIKEEMSSLYETQRASENPITNQATEFATTTSKPYITGPVKASDVSSNRVGNGDIKDEDQAARIFAAKHGISTDDYDVSCQAPMKDLRGNPIQGGSWACSARKSTLGAESVYSGESEFGPAGAATT
jgi:hypothetical protein